jgi:hypothetical protein
MGIQVQCPNGHVFRVKDKYAGKKGLCPHCEGQVIVHVPDVLTAAETNYRRAVIGEHRAAHPVDTSDSSVFEDAAEVSSSGSGTSGSLLGSSVIRHRVRCTSCGEPVPMWYAKCPACGHFIEHF